MNIESYAMRGDRKETRTDNGSDNGSANILDKIQLSPCRVRGFREKTARQVQHTSWPVTGGKPIEHPMAVALRRIVFGQCPAPVKTEYFSRGPGLVFREADHDLSYALIVSHVVGMPVASSILMAIQTHIIRALLFDLRPTKVSKPNPLKPSFTMQQDALCTAITDIIWKAGGNQHGVICLPHPVIRHVDESDIFNGDGVTEKLHLFECNNREDLRFCIRRNLSLFQEDPGPAVLLLIYSAVLSRGIERIEEDMGAHWKSSTNSYNRSLLSYSGDISFSALNLLLAGRAASYLHNGTRYERYDDENKIIPEPGLYVRSTIGLLLWMRTEEKTLAYKLGSRLKTPLYPIWLVIASDQSGVLFCNDRNLLRDYRSEFRFHLHYYTSTHHQVSPAVLLIRTRMLDDLKEEKNQERATTQNVLTNVIRTKWSGAHISWNGLKPFL